MNIYRENNILVFIAVIVLAACLRLYHLGYYSLWMDEVYQVSLQSRAISLGQVIEFATQQNQPPLDYIIGYFISEFVPFSEFSVRFPSFVFGTGTVIVAFVFVRRLFNLWTAILSSLMLSFSTILIYFSQEARPYSIFFFFLILLLTIFFWILESSGEKNRRWLLFIFIAALTLITRGMVPVTALIALNVAFILSVLVSFVEEKKFVYPLSPVVLRNLVLSTAIAGLFYVPFFLKIWTNSHHYLDESLGFGGKVWSLFEPFQLVVTSRLPYNLENKIFLCLVGFILGAFFIIRNRLKKPSQFVFFLYALLEPLVFVYLYYIVIDTTVLKPKSKYFVQSIIPIFVISSYGYYKIANIFSEKLKTNRQYLVYSIPIITVLVLSFVRLPGYYNKPKADYRGAVKYLRTIYKNEDVAIYDTLRAFRSWEPHLYGRGVYYGKHMKVRQYNWSKWISLLNDGFDTSGRLFLFLHAGKENGLHFTNNDKLIERNFEQMTIIYAKDESLSLKETTLIYIDEMLKFFPENSSKVDLHLAKAKLLCKDSTETAKQHIDLAEGFISGGSVDYQCY